MIRLAFQIFGFLVKPPRRQRLKRDRIIGYSLFKSSFRIGGIQSGLKLFFSQAARCIYWPFALKKIKVDSFEDSQILVFDGVSQSKNQRESFLNFFGGHEHRNYVFRDDVLGFISLSDRIMYFLMSLFLLPLTIISWNGSFKGRVFSLRLLIEVRALLCVASHSSCKKVYIFNIFEPDTNWIASILMERDIHVTKIPSEVPLKFHNENILASELIICNEYQREELDRFSETQQIGFVSKLWGPEASPNVFERYREMNFQPKAQVGFYSSGGWLRAKLSHWEGEQKKIMEEHSIEELVNALKGIGIDDLLIFLHPREKLSEILESTREYYSDLGSKLDVNIKLDETLSAECFDSIHLGLTTLSTIAYERIFFGFPTFILNKSTSDFPISSSPFSNLFVKESGLLQSQIKDALQQTRSQFYETRKLRHYQHPDILL
ncbi:MAG: hypothetical protein HN728_07405 [Flavobacteriales bacterium]|jgi:hypothetical protein|nr:hypothetical protein [Flavobacteriales bacterium]